MSAHTADVVICGAGIAGITAAYHLSVTHGVTDIVLVDAREPMTLTSDKSTECYRNWWPGPNDAMVRFMNRSIDLLDALAVDSNNFFHLNRRGYVFLTGDPDTARRLEETARERERLGAGPLRVHRDTPDKDPYIPAPAEGFLGLPTGADLVLDPALIRAQFPFITERAVAMLHTRRCGWLSAQQLGTYLLDQARQRGARLVRGRVSGVEVARGRVQAVQVDIEGRGTDIQTRNFIAASGPLLKETGAMLGLELPIHNELHAKVAIKDPLRVIARDAPLMIWEDPVHLFWDPETRAELSSHEETRWLLEEFPAGVHFRPEGGEDSPILLMIWTYDTRVQEPSWPLRFDPELPEVLLRGLVHMVPGLEAYLDRMPSPVVDGGYYCKTRENRPLIGPLPVEGAFVYGALSGFGIMAGMAGGELLAAHVSGSHMPDYASAFMLDRYADPGYQRLLASWDASGGQL